jgi:hypothetical protein
MPDANVLNPNPNPVVSPSDVVESAAGDTSAKEQIAVDALKNVLNEVVGALKKIGEDVDKLSKRVDNIEKSISVKITHEPAFDGEKNKKDKPKLGEYVVDTVEFAKTSANMKTSTGGETVVGNPEVQIIKSIFTANKELSVNDIYYLVLKNIKPKVM